jgi:GntR family transcriptional regulator/MocR family aminotransferase
MPKRASGALFLPLNLDTSSEIPLYRQLYEAMRHAILSGQLAVGTRLPSTRLLSKMLGIARTTVVVAFEQLFAEGYVEGRQGSGTYVSAILPSDLPPSFLSEVQISRASADSASPRNGVTILTSEPRRRIARRGQLPGALTTSNIAPAVAGLRAFAAGSPDLTQFPFKIWARLSTQRWLNTPQALLNYSNPAGYLPLRAEVATYLSAVRAVRCEPEQVIIVAGAQQGITLAAQVLLDPGDWAWVEDPCYPSARRALLGAGARIEPVPVDQEGMDVVAGIERCPEARLVYVTPSYQYPVGTTLSLARRLRLLQWARRTGAWILEDDYDCEYRYSGRPLSSLQGLDRSDGQGNGSVIYVGTFSKVLFPGLRLGYLVVPPDLVDPFVAARGSMDRHSAMHEQIVLTDFLYQGHFARHIRHMRQLYAERQNVLVSTAQEELAGLLTVLSAETGMHLIGWLADGMRDEEAFRCAAQHEVAALPLSFYTLQTKQPDALLLGYTAVTPEEIRVGVKQLARALETVPLSLRGMLPRPTSKN